MRCVWRVLVLGVLVGCGGGGESSGGGDTGVAEDTLELRVVVDGGSVVLQWDDTGYVHHRLWLEQGGQQFGPLAVSSGITQVSVPETIDWSFLTELQAGTVTWRLEGDKSFFFNNVEELGSGTFEVGLHFPGHWDKSAVSVAGLPDFADVGETIQMSGTVGDGGLRSNIVIVPPSVFPESVALVFDGELGPGTEFAADYTFAEAGLYVVEYNAPGGGAFINHPVYVGDHVPLVAHPVSTVPSKHYPIPLPLGDLRQELLDLVNARRGEVGRSTLALNDKLNEIAQAKSQDMVDKGYFGHTSPTWGGPSARAAEFGFNGPLGENIASNSSVLGAHLGLFWSPAHRQNILGESYTHVGFGFALNGDNLVVTENYSSL